MSTTNDVNVVTPKVGKYGDVQRTKSVAVPTDILSDLYSATRKLRAESQQNHLGFVITFPGEYLFDKCAYW